MSYTKGKWTVADFVTTKSIQSENGDIIAIMQKTLRSPGCDTANARLIAAAPALLEACKASLAAIGKTGAYFGDSGDCTEVDEAENMLIAAIKLAERE